MIAWTAIEWARRGKPSGMGLATGAVAGLAAITPASGYVPVWAALVIGLGAGAICHGAVHLKKFFHYDDALDVVGVHMVAGVIGVALTGVFASLVINPTGVSGGWSQFGRQVVLAVLGLAYPFVMTLIIIRFADMAVHLRVGPGEQAEGLDLGEHGEVAYAFDDQDEQQFPTQPRATVSTLETEIVQHRTG
jgi:Amt family ammonium transporter